MNEKKVRMKDLYKKRKEPVEEHYKKRKVPREKEEIVLLREDIPSIRAPLERKKPQKTITVLDDRGKVLNKKIWINSRTHKILKVLQEIPKGVKVDTKTIQKRLLRKGIKDIATDDIARTIFKKPNRSTITTKFPKTFEESGSKDGRRKTIIRRKNIEIIDPNAKRVRSKKKTKTLSEVLKGGR